MVRSWKAELLEDMKIYWQQLIGDASPQSTEGPAVSQANMGPDALRQLSPADDREASRAQHKSGSKRAGSESRRHSGSRERSSVDRYWTRDRRPPTSPYSSSPTQHRSPPAKRSRRDRREMSNDICSSEGRQRSQRPRRPWSSRSPGHWRSDPSQSPSPHRRYRSSPAPSRRSYGAGTTERPAGHPSLSPLRRSSSHHRRSRHPSRDCHSPPPPRSRGPHHCMSSSSSRSPSPKRSRTESITTTSRLQVCQPGMWRTSLWFGYSSPATAGGQRWWTISTKHSSTWFPWTRTIFISGWLYPLCGKGPKTFRRSDPSASAVALRRSNPG